jgi:hypothetical protein
MQFTKSRIPISLVLALLLNGVVCADQASPKVLLYHSFDAAIDKGEAESNPGESKVVVCPAPNRDGEARVQANNDGAQASGRACVEPGAGQLTFKVKIKETGNYSLALRYLLTRHMHPLWPQNSTAKTPWTENYAEVEVTLDGKKKPIGKKPEHLYPKLHRQSENCRPGHHGGRGSTLES